MSHCCYKRIFTSHVSTDLCLATNTSSLFFFLPKYQLCTLTTAQSLEVSQTGSVGGRNSPPAVSMCYMQLIQGALVFNSQPDLRHIALIIKTHQMFSYVFCGCFLLQMYSLRAFLPTDTSGTISGLLCPSQARFV